MDAKLHALLEQHGIAPGPAQWYELSLALAQRVYPTGFTEAKLGARFEVHIEKGRSLYGPEASPFEAQLTIDAAGKQAWTMRALEESQDDRISELADLGMKPAEIAADLGVHKTTVYRQLKKTASQTNGHA